MCLYKYNYQNFVVIFAQVFGATQSKCCLVFASLNPFLFTRTQVLHCRSAHTQSRAGMKQFTRYLSISLWKLFLRAERIYLRAERTVTNAEVIALAQSRMLGENCHCCLFDHEGRSCRGYIRSPLTNEGFSIVTARHNRQT